MKLRFLAAALIAAATIMFCKVAVAGDVYLRGGVGLHRPAEATFTDTDCSSAAPAALYGCGLGGDGAPHRSRGNFGTAPLLEVGLGYTVTPAIRIEVVVEHLPRLAFDGRANFLEPERQQSVAADISSLSGMLAGYVDLPGFDLPGFGLPMLGPFAPFVGAGAGWVHTRIGEMQMTFPRTTTIVPGARRRGFGWMLAAGVSASLGERMTLDLAWRLTDLGEVHTGEGRGRVVWRDGSREPLPLDLADTRARLRSHGLKLSLRYRL